MVERRRESVTSDEPTILAEPLLDAIVMEDIQSDGGLADPANTEESDWTETFCQGDNLVNQIVTPKAGFRRWGR